jgi:hypothetical protein
VAVAVVPAAFEAAIARNAEHQVDADASGDNGADERGAAARRCSARRRCTSPSNATPTFIRTGLYAGVDVYDVASAELQGYRRYRLIRTSWGKWSTYASSGVVLNAGQLQRVGVPAERPQSHASR